MRNYHPTAIVRPLPSFPSRSRAKVLKSLRPNLTINPLFHPPKAYRVAIVQNVQFVSVCPFRKVALDWCCYGRNCNIVAASTPERSRHSTIHPDMRRNMKEKPSQLLLLSFVHLRLFAWDVMGPAWTGCGTGLWARCGYKVPFSNSLKHARSCLSLVHAKATFKSRQMPSGSICNQQHSHTVSTVAMSFEVPGFWTVRKDVEHS